MKNDNLPGLSPLWLISLALVLGTLIATTVPISIAANVGVKASDWIGFAGSVTAGAMTLIAGVIAWFSVQKQIEAQEQIEQRSIERVNEQQEAEAAAAKHAARIVLTQPTHAATAVMARTRRYIAATIAPSSQVGIGPHSQVSEAKLHLDNAMTHLNATLGHFAVAEVWKTLAPEDRGNYLVITSVLNTLATIYTNPPNNLIDVVANQHDTLVKLAVYLRAFDDELADVYERDAGLQAAHQPESPERPKRLSMPRTGGADPSL
jgi:hypothetical protein